MSYHWLIESLVELRDYAADNDLPAVAEHLDDALRLAHAEIASRDPDGSKNTLPDT